MVMTKDRKDKQQEESVFEFPCEFPLKIMGKNKPELLDFVKSVLPKHVPDISAKAYAYKTSKQGRFMSITVTFTATSKEQLDNIYTEITVSDLALYVI